MLEKNEKISYFDAHFHYAVCKSRGIPVASDGFSGCSCAHSLQEWELQRLAPPSVIQAAGIHPQSCGRTDFRPWADFIEELLRNGSICAIGEAGFDYFTEELREFKKEQESAFCIQLELAKFYGCPVVIHCRKANEKLFEYARELRKLPGVLFHSFMGSAVEAKSLVSRDINCAFSFGKQLLNGNKKVIECVLQLPKERLLCETDAPFQFLKGESFTLPEEIVKVYSAACALRGDFSDFDEFCSCMEENCRTVLC